MEAKVFASEEIRQLFRNYVVVSLHCDHPDDDVKAKNLALEKTLTQNYAQPQWVIVDPRNGNVLQKWANLQLNLDDWKRWLAVRL